MPFFDFHSSVHSIECQAFLHLWDCPVSFNSTLAFSRDRGLGLPPHILPLKGFSEANNAAKSVPPRLYFRRALCLLVTVNQREELALISTIFFLQIGNTQRKMQQDQRRNNSTEVDFFTEYGEANRYKIQEVIGKGSYGVVCSAIDSLTGEKVAIKKINDIFEHVSDATQILREIKLVRLLRHPDIVEIKHIMLPPSRREFRDIYVVFELMESDLHQVIKVNDDLTPEHYQFFLYQLLRSLKYIHTANVFHRDLKPKNVLANADCILKICDFGLARVAFNDTPTVIFWTDYVATRWYRAPELCGSFFSKYTPAIDIWSIGCIFSEILTGKPLFPGKNVVHQLDLITDLLGTPSLEAIARVRNEKTRRYLSSMRKKKPMPFSQKFPNADPLALRLLERLLAFEPNDHPTAEEALADPYFKGLANVEREPSARTISKMEFEFERRRVTKEHVRELIYREILEYHPQMLKEYLEGADSTNFMYPSAVDQFKKQFAHLEEHYGKGGMVSPLEREHVSLPRPSVLYSHREAPLPEQTYSFSSRNPALEAHEKASRIIRETAQHQQDRTSRNTRKVPLPEQAYSCSSRNPALEAHYKASRIIRETEQHQQDRTSGNMRKVPLQVPQKMLQGGSAKPGKVIGSVIPYENCGIVEGYDSRMFTVMSSQYDASVYSYLRQSSDGKVQQDEREEVAIGSNLMQSAQYAGTGARKVAASHSGMAHWS